MNKTKIDWVNEKEGWKLDYTWNPVYGCKNNCFYCYARAIHNMRMGIKKKRLPQYEKPFSEIQFFPERLKQLKYLKWPSTIFVGDMGDIFWQDSENMQTLLSVIAEYREHRFLFLTKIPKVYGRFEFSDNCWLGLTVEAGTQLGQNGFMDFQLMDFPNKFLSIEPILGSFEDKNLSFVKWIIVGKMTGKYGRDHYYSSSWPKSILHDNVYFKNNIKGYL